MQFIKYSKIIPGALFLLTIFFSVSYNDTDAEMRGTEWGQNNPVNMRSMKAMSDREVVVEMKTDPAGIRAGSVTKIVFSVKDREGKPVQNLSIHHDRIMHVVIASQDFRIFAHIHPENLGPITPEMKKTARFPVQYNFPKAGSYIIGVDFAVGEQLFSRHFLVEVSGTPHLGILKEDFTGKKRFGGYDVTLTSLPKIIRAGEQVILSYDFKKQNRPVTDLEPYLSAPMHVAIISSDLKNFIHEHGEVQGMSMSHSNYGNSMHMVVPKKFGPEITVHAVFPSRGAYQIFGQTQHHGKIILTSFMVKVE
jgi:hypothetical protein